MKPSPSKLTGDAADLNIGDINYETVKREVTFLSRHFVILTRYLLVLMTFFGNYGEKFPVNCSKKSGYLFFG